jgi:hypothetical protein
MQRARAVIPAKLSGARVYLGDYPDDAHWAPRYPTSRGFVGNMRIYYIGPIRKPTVDAIPQSNSSYEAPQPERPPRAEVSSDLRDFEGRWEILKESSSGSDEREFIVLCLVENKVLGTGGKDNDLLEFTSYRNGKLSGMLRPGDGSAAMPISATLSSNGREITFKIAPPASEYVIVRARKVGEVGQKAQQLEQLRKQLENARRSYQQALERGTAEEIRTARETMERLEAEIRNITPPTTKR